jgi:hypothetical protein
LKEFLSKENGSAFGPVMRIFTTDGHLVNDLESLEDAGRYICVGAEKFNSDSSTKCCCITNSTTVPKAIVEPNLGKYIKQQNATSIKTEIPKVIRVYR